MNKWKAKKAQEKQRETLKNKQKMPFFRGKTGFLFSLRSKERKEKQPKKKQNKQTKQQTKKTNKEGLGPSEVALRAISPDPKKNQKKTTKNKKNINKTKTTKKYQKMSFSIISQKFLFFGGLPNIPFFTTWPRKRAPPKHYKNRASAHQFLKNSYASRNGHSWTKKNQIHKFQLSFFLVFFFFFHNKMHQN